jgi:hypothetical protein
VQEHDGRAVAAGIEIENAAGRQLGVRLDDSGIGAGR